MKSFVTSTELIVLAVGAFLLAWAVRQVIQLGFRRAVRMSQVRPGAWRGRLRRRGDIDSEVDVRRRQRADAAARMLGHFTSLVIAVAAALMGLQLLGVNPVYAISSAGFLGFALAISGQEIIRNLLSGTMALLEDRYAVGDEVTFMVSGTEFTGTVDLMGATSVRLRTTDGATWHAGHGTIECVINASQIAASVEIIVPTTQWEDIEDDAVRRLTQASNDVGLTGVVFLPELAAQIHPTGATSVTIRSNRPLTADQRDLVRHRLTEL